MSDPIHYTPTLEELEEQEQARARVPHYVEQISENIESLKYESSDNGEKLDQIIALLERQNDLLVSIDHAHYNKRSDESILLSRIIVLLTIMGALFFALSWWN
ncbi:hypothetical protein [Celeribacter sp.]|uniref:hypothetical protein n=1 Tax=Celeribacter sp. TaxID=1890673 RepID=UPI003A906621